MNDSLGALLAIVFIWLVVKFAYGGSSPRSSDPTTGPPVTQGPGLGLARNRQVSQEMVDSLTTMFPHISESSIRYDLQRSGSVDLTCERILAEGRLPEPPAGLFAPPPNRTTAPNNGNGNGHAPTGAALATPNTKSGTSKKSPSLISRFGLESRLKEESHHNTSPDDSSDQSLSLGDASFESLKGKEREKVMGWGEEKAERERRLRERKERMILEARKRMQEKAAAKASSSSSAQT